MPRPKKHKRFTRLELGTHYWAIYDNHVHIGVVAAGSKANYYFTDKKGLVVSEGFGTHSIGISMKPYYYDLSIQYRVK